MDYLKIIAVCMIIMCTMSLISNIFNIIVTYINYKRVLKDDKIVIEHNQSVSESLNQINSNYDDFLTRLNMVEQTVNTLTHVAKIDVPKNDKKLKCWKCGKELNSSNMSNIMYPTNPPKYTCVDCEKSTKVCPQKKGENCPFPLGTHCDECEYK